ncbi:ATP-grasp domain-containing protein [Xanthobacter agilis]|uniref:ATP-grasp superfamily ATP-dependent carboligase n=1 Tax=Xanthobacter agilis TaxID=47492 RepID=A0ABU0LA73_XANAG|nr:ATP-grasp domain-containing protein [Xanthobacter agilis]MDQ0504031.1 putative ATP-grasp superfamily ATP-dependent carboligase [Xanthobacter agilis]
MDLALIALSARPLAASAARAGFAALALDLFADLDTCAHAARCVRVHKRNGYAFDGDDLIQALTSLAPAGLPVVLGGGLEDEPDLMARIAARNPILGNSPETVRVLKDPLALAGLCAHLGIPFPDVTIEAPAPDTFGAAGVIAKKIGGAGGGHIRRRAAGDLSAPEAGYYLQREVKGEAYSLLLLAAGRRAIVVGASHQWRDGDPDHPFRYGGVAGPVALPEAQGEAMRDGAIRIALACGLVGLVSMDFVVSDDGWFLVEVNPRLGATLDIFDVDPLPPLLGLHLAACGGRLPASVPSPTEVHAAQVLYAEDDLLVPADALPAHVADRPAAGAAIPRGAPVCTVRASGPSLESARARLETLTRELRGQFGFATTAEPAA